MSRTGVALRKESVDRNPVFPVRVNAAGVALRKESVDRNAPQVVRVVLVKKSLSARRAWIEIGLSPRNTTGMPCRSPQGERG